MQYHASTTREKFGNPKSLSRNETSLSLTGKSLGKALHVVLQGATVGQELHVGTVHLDAASSLLLQVLLATERGETPVLGDDDLLATGELVLGAAEGLEGEGTVWYTVSSGQQADRTRHNILESRVRTLMMI